MISVSEKYFFDESQIIRSLRKIHGLSQQQFCSLLGYSQSALSKIENGHLSPDLKFVIQLSEKLKIDLNIFRFGHITHPYNDNDFQLSNFSPYAIYLKEGFLSAKCIFFLLETLRRNKFPKIYQSLNMDKDILSFSSIKFNSRFINELIKYAPKEKVEEIFKSYIPQDEIPFSESLIKSIVINNQMINVSDYKKEKKYLQFAISLKNSNSQNTSNLEDSFLLKFICFDFLVTFHTPLKIHKSQNRAEHPGLEIKIYVSGF
ncbi:MAG: helix-turn-helix transcriptional regulator [Bacteriovoracaceae bacterium]|nr:helix-turn-helix transcriptional regulator [Bacteriovoracaceae bacterium]